MIREIERYTGEALAVAVIPGLEPKAKPERPRSTKPAGNGKRHGEQKKWQGPGKSSAKPAHAKSGSAVKREDNWGNGFGNEPRARDGNRAGASGYGGGRSGDALGGRKLTGSGPSFGDDRRGGRSGYRSGGYARDGQRRDSGSRSGPRAGGRRDY